MTSMFAGRLLFNEHLINIANSSYTKLRTFTIKFQ